MLCNAINQFIDVKFMKWSSPTYAALHHGHPLKPPLNMGHSPNLGWFELFISIQSCVLGTCDEIEIYVNGVFRIS